MGLVRLVYMSQLKITMDYYNHTDEFVERICRHAEMRNKEKNISGALMFHHDTHEVIQVLEGEETTVKKLMEFIKKDPRHRHIQILDVTNITDRDFKGWHMMRGGRSAWRHVRQYFDEFNHLQLLQSFDIAFGPECPIP